MGNILATPCAPHQTQGPPLHCMALRVPSTQASVPFACCLGCCPHSAVAPAEPWVLADMSFLWRLFLTPGILCWRVFSFVLCPSAGLSSVGTSSTHLAPCCNPAPSPELICSLYPPQSPNSSPFQPIFLLTGMSGGPLGLRSSSIIQYLMSTSATAYHCPPPFPCPRLDALHCRCPQHHSCAPECPLLGSSLMPPHHSHWPGAVDQAPCLPSPQSILNLLCPAW